MSNEHETNPQQPAGPEQQPQGAPFEPWSGRAAAGDQEDASSDPRPEPGSAPGPAGPYSGSPGGPYSGSPGGPYAGGTGGQYPSGTSPATAPPYSTTADSSGYGQPPYSGVPGQPAWSPGPGPGPESGPRRGGGRTALAVLAVVGLMGVAAVGGGIAGAAIYGETGSSGPGTNVTQVVDGPQLDYTSLASIASDVSPSVVSIRIGRFGGSGVVMSEDGYIITNAHVVEVATGDRVDEVRFSDGTVAEATVVGADPLSDVAVIKVDDVDGLVPAGFADSGQVLVGDTVLAIGSPLGFEGSVTQGIVSALDRTLEPERPGEPSLSGLLQTDAAINEGNSGGALVNLSGEVVGINTAIAVENQDDGFLGVGFAVPSNRATEVAEQLISGEEVSHPYLGVSVAPASGGGAVIGEVVPDSPADEAGLQPGDVVVRLGDRQIADSNDLVSAVQSADVGETLELEYQRNGATQTAEVTLGESTG